ncbi:hypothetical protein [Micromonospora sp. DT233]|uniref:hypothetical protein n=1 Tax=Micromonospora sp. DT233 TaxID=3393432 RepID=UPI003CF90CAB
MLGDSLLRQCELDLDHICGCASGPHGAGYTLHQLRHSGLTHLAAKGRSAAELQAKSRHRHLATLGIYVRLGEETSARITAENDQHHRRHRR